ncbi:alpha/beta hydrolase family protein [Neotamlana laminarinivorans]|uniref:Acetylxylan esterase n=1 Tax=Neotamlana laminarinivorans TaxID=2883124 RepID=A0A9X1L2R4_9FLAO|nr:acetylxylan esterase [Tamlana laminarinivorans]MCB4797879.1 acetylxylan esterase [Tamlana laminarinivorans]
MTLMVSCTTQKIKSPWNLEQLYKTPNWRKTEKAKQEGVTSILYESSPVSGQKVEVFAYYGIPEGDTPKDGWPAVVCVHGGGGTAFHEWVKKWNKHGYAAISMDLEGHYPITEDINDKKSPRIPTENPGLTRVGTFNDFEKPITEQWYYHAVAQVIHANSLLRSFSEVNPNKIGITGISWGGILTSTVIGLDNRFKFAIPVYGCGFLPDSDGLQGENIKPGKYTEFVNLNYDGSAYFNNVRIPTLWINGTNDKHFPLLSTQKSAQAVNGEVTKYYKLNMPHGHYAGWKPKEIYAFANSIVKGDKALIEIEKPQIKLHVIQVEFHTTSTVKSANLVYTKDSGKWVNRHWQKVPATILNPQIKAEIPKDAILGFIEVMDGEGLMVSSEFIQLNKDNNTKN